jgi:hypothetical protein
MHSTNSDFVSTGPMSKYHYFSEVGLVSSPNYEMRADGGETGLWQARKTWSGLGKVVL